MSTTRRSARLGSMAKDSDAETSGATVALSDAPVVRRRASAQRKRERSPETTEVAQSSARSRPQSSRRALASTAKAARAAARKMKEADGDGEHDDDVQGTAGETSDDPMEIVRTDGALVNAYEATNMVKSALVAEFERRGEKLIELEREAHALKQKTKSAESLLAATTAEVESLREMKSDHEKSKVAMREELAEERQANMLALEREVGRACEAESRAKTLAEELSAMKETLAAIERERAEDSAEDDAERYPSDFAEKNAELEYSVACLQDEVSNLKKENVSLQARFQTVEAERVEVTTRAEQAEEALRECESLVAQAEATVLDIRREADDAKLARGADGDEESSKIIEDLRGMNRTLQEELRVATREAAEVKTLRRKAEFAATCEERAMAAESRALRAEASVIDTSSLQARLSKLEYLENDWASVIDRLSPGSVKVPSDLVERVISLETRLTSQTGEQGKMMSDLAQAQMKETAATRRATEAEEKYQKIESSASSAVEALAVAERQIAMMKGQVESLNRIVKSYEDEGNAAAARKSTEKEKSKAASDRAMKELEKLLAHAKERIAVLDGELSEAKTRAETAEAAATAAAAALPVENPVTLARIETLEREREELLERLKRESAQEDDSKALKVLHFKSNPVASAMRSALEKEVESLRSEAAGLREALSKLQQGSVSSASEADMTVMKRKLEDLQKREQRLMTVFKRQISAFREACHKIFGYKIEMNEDAGACTFTLTSDYATNPTDAFAFKYDDKSSTVSLKETPFVAAPEIRRSVETFVTRMRSIPAFIANHTIETFNQRDDDVDVDDDGVDAMDA